MTTKVDLDQLRLAYKKAVDAWVEAIRTEEALATPDHSLCAFCKGWDILLSALFAGDFVDAGL